MSKKKLFVRIILYVLFISSLFLLIGHSGIHITDLSPDYIRNLAHDNLLLILIIMFTLMFLQNVFTFIPLILVITINISLFGFWNGYLYSCFCSSIASVGMFLSIRYLFPNLFTNAKWQTHSEKIKKNGFKFVFFGRIFPFLPTNLINIASGLSSIKGLHFFFATTFGNAIYALILAGASANIIHFIMHHPYVFSCILICIIAIYSLFLKRKSMKRLT